ncbi:MAG: SDR family NAD(P)-dependent oxidoreductase [bacterium]
MKRYTAFVTGADHGLGLALTKNLLAREWNVVAGRYGKGPKVPAEKSIESIVGAYPEQLLVVPLDVNDLESVRAAAETTLAASPTVDLIINNAGILGDLKRSVSDGLDYDDVNRTLSVNALGPLRVVESLLPGMASSELKRLCFVSSEAGSVTRSYRKAWYGYCMSKAALNMGVSILFNDLRPSGYTFRVYHPGWMQTFMAGAENLEATLTPAEAADAALAYFLDATVDEDRLVLRDNEGNEWPW